MNQHIWFEEQLLLEPDILVYAWSNFPNVNKDWIQIKQTA